MNTFLRLKLKLDIKTSFKISAFLLCAIFSINVVDAQQTRFTINGQNASATSAVSVCINTPVSFENTSTGNSTNPRWIFKGGNPATANGNTVNNVRFPVVGTDSATLIVSRGANNDTLTVPISVVANTVTANFSSSPSGQCANIPVSFTNQSTPATGLSYAWNFGDPNSGAANNATITNPTQRFIGTPGNNNQTFNVRLIARNNIGCADTVNKDVTVRQLPGTQLLGSNPTIYEGKTFFRICTSNPSGDVVIINQSSTASTNTNYTIKWGNGSPDFTGTTMPNQTQNFLVGIYDLRFIVTGGNGCADTATYGVFVGSNPAVGLGNPGNTSICTGSTLTFPISNTATNPPGTFYTVTFNDGSSALQFQHPAPSSVTHQFDVTSCGTNSSFFPNSFAATITATNPCLSSQASVVPIYVSEKARAIIGIGPRDTVCTGMNVTVNDNSGNISFINGSTCSDGNRVWTITPSTGYTVSGTLGNDNSFPTDPSFWTKGSPALNLNFTQPGIYTIKLRVGNPVCGRDSVIRTICVNPAPIANFTVNNNIGCAPLTVNTTNTSNTPNCGTNTFQWAVSYVPLAGCTPSTSDFTLQGGTTLTSAAPIFRFNNPGTYTISLVTRNSDGVCSSAPVTQTITVKEKPNASFNLQAAVCQGGSINLSSSSNNCGGTTATGFSWAFPGGIPASSNIANPGNVQFNSAGNITVQLTATNECGSTVVTRPLTVNPTPDVTVVTLRPLRDTVCFGETVLLKARGANAYQWYFNGVGIPGATDSQFVATQSGNYSILISNGSCSVFAKDTARIIVKPRISGTISPAAAVTCNGSNITLTANGSSKYQWYRNGNLISGATSASYTTNQAGSYTVMLFKDECSNLAENAVEVSNLNLSGTITPSSGFICSGSNITLTASGGVTYQWFRNGAIVSGATSASYTTTQSGTYTVRIINGTCNVMASNSAVVSTISRPSGSISPSSATVCQGSTVTLTATGANTYQWYRNGSIISGATNASFNAALGGTYTVRLYVGSCNALASNSVVVTERSAPSGSIFPSSGTVCGGSTILLTANGGTSYQWYRNGAPITNANNSTYSASLSGTYTVQINNNGCSAMSTNSAVITSVTSVSGSISPANSTICAGGEVTLTVAGGTSYQWFRNSTLINGANSNTLNVTTSGTYTARITLGNCSSMSSNSAVVSVIPLPNSSISPSSGVICSGSSITLSTSGGTSYQWLRNGSNISGVTGASYSTTIPGTYTVRIFNGSCSALSTNSVNITSVSSPSGSISPSSAQVCPGNTVTLTATGGTSYQWFRNGTSINGATSATYVTNQAGTYTVRLFVGICNAMATNSAVVTSASNPSGIISPSSGLICGSGSVVLAATGGTSYQWMLNNVNISGATDATYNARQAGTYSVRIFNGACSALASNTAIITSSPLPSGNITPATSTVCQGQSVALRANGGTSYQWYRNNIAISGATSATYNANQSGTYSVDIINNGCTARASNSSVVTVNPLPTGTITPSSATICDGSTHIFSATNGFRYQWLKDSQQIPGADSSSYRANTSGSYTVRLTNQFGCSANASNSGVLTVIQRPTANFTFDKYCANVPTRFTSTSNISNSGTVSYAWQFGTLASSSQQSPTYTFTRAGTYNVRLTITPTACPNLSATITKPITIVPPLISIRYPDVKALENQPVELNARILDTGTTYLWQPSRFLSNTNISNPVYNGNAEQQYFINISNRAGCTARDTLKVMVFKQADIFVPQGFTPNGDGQNDKLIPFLVAMKQLTYFRIFNRWGQLLYETKQEGQGWDGNFKGTPQPMETYTWIAEGVDLGGQQVKRSGGILLIR